MSRIAMMTSLVPVLGGLMLLGGCATLESDGYWASSYPVYPRRVYVDHYRYRNPDGLDVVYDPGPRLYSVVRSPGLYWHDGYYYRKHRGHWEQSRHHRGPWAYHRHEPPRVRMRHEPPSGRPMPIAVPDRRPDRRPVYRTPYREPDDRRRPDDRRWSDRDGGRFVRHPPEQRPDPGRSPGPDRRQIERRPVAQPIPRIVGPGRVESPHRPQGRPQVRPQPQPVGPAQVPRIAPRPEVSPQPSPALPVRARNRPPVPGGEAQVQRAHRAERQGTNPPRSLGRRPNATTVREDGRQPGGAPRAAPRGRQSAEGEGRPRAVEQPRAPLEVRDRSQAPPGRSGVRRDAAARGSL